MGREYFCVCGHESYFHMAGCQCGRAHVCAECDCQDWLLAEVSGG